MCLMEREMKKISQILSPDYTGSVECTEEEEDDSEASEPALKLALQVLKGMKQQDLVEKLTKCKMDALPLLKSQRCKVNCSLLVV